MAPRPAMDEDDVEGDMTPMIDVIFLLLIFFILTTKFVPEEKIISSLMPTNMGQSSAPPQEQLEEKDKGDILIYPGRMSPRMQPSQYDADWKANPFAANARVKFNQVDEGLMISLQTMGDKDSDELEAAIEEIHAYITDHLGRLEDTTQSDNRGEQPPITIHCFSGMPWSVALVAYDAVRAYEALHIRKANLSPEELQNSNLARPVTFAPPRLRGYREWEMGYELMEIIHTK